MMRELRRQLSASRQDWALIVCLPLAQVSNLALSTVVGPLRDGLGISYTELGLVLGAFGVARLAMDLPAGSIVQRFNPRHVLLAALGTSLLAAVVGVFAPSAWVVGVSRLLHGISSSVVQTAVLAWLVGGSSSANRGRVMALSEAFFSVIALLTPVSVGLLAALITWRAAFAVGVLGSLAAVVAVLVWTTDRAAAEATGLAMRHQDAASSGWSSLRLGGPLLIAAYLITFVIFFGRQALISTLLPLVGSEKLSLSPIFVGIGLSMASLISIGVLLAGGSLGDRYGRPRLVVPGILVLLVCQVAMFLIFDPWTYLLVASMQGLGFLMNSFPPGLIADALPPYVRSRGIAVYRLTADLAFLAAPLAVGLTLEHAGFAAATWVPIIPSLVVLAAVLWLRQRGRTRRHLDADAAITA